MTPATPQPNSEPDFESLIDQCEIHTVGPMPIISGFCHKIGIGEAVNAHIDCQSTLDPGTIVNAMVINTLCGRSPLYRVEDFWAEQDTELLLGRPICSSALNDDALGRTLDRIHHAGSMKIFTHTALKACRLFEIDTSQGQFDTTSINLWGDYNNSTPDENSQAPYVTHGYSKDKRPDLKQVMFSMLCVEGNIPLLGKVEDGNASDTKLNNEHLQEISKLIKQDQISADDFLYVADCKLVTRANLELLGDDYFVTRLPASFKAHNAAIDAALKKAQPADWEDVGSFNQTPSTKKRPAAEYRISEEQIELYDKKYRAIVVHSSNTDKRRQKRIEREAKKAEQSALKSLKKAQREIYACQSDADRALEKLRLETSSELWIIEGKTEAKNVYARGRVAAGAERKVERVDWTLCLELKKNEQLQEQLNRRAGCFVLLTNTPNSDENNPSWSGEKMLRAYKEQHGIERNFSFIKDPLIANDIFLKKPERIEALGLILLLALLVWSLMQRAMRQSVEKGEVKLTDLDNKPTQRPTAFIMIHKFHGVQIVKLNGARRLAPGCFRRDQTQFLLALGLDRHVFTRPPTHQAG